MTVLAAGGAVLALVSRVPFVARYLWDHDSIQFALAVERFDLAAHQPHPPGYPLYIALLEVLAALGVGPRLGMVALSCGAAALGAAAMGALAHRLAGGGPLGERTGVFAVALYVFNPLLWFYGELPLVYAVEGGLTVAVAWAVAAMPESRGRFLLACGLLALSGGMRPSTLVLLLPLLLWGLVATWRRRRLSPGLVVAGAGLGAGVVLTWLLPLLAAAGGLAAYRQISGEHFGALLPQTSVLYGAGFAALAHNGFLVAKWAAQGLVPGGLALAILGLMAPARLLAGLRLLAEHAGFLVAWALPPMLFFTLFHITKAGYTLIHLPALLLAVALLAAPALSGRKRGEDETSPDRAAWIWTAVASLIVAVTGGLIFLGGRDREPDSPRWLALVRHDLNLGEIRAYERDLESALEILDKLPPESTVLATVELSGRGASGSEGFLYPWHRHLQWYLPRMPVAYLVPEQQRVAVSPGDHRPFQPVPWDSWIPATADRVAWVLAGSPDERFELPPGELVSDAGRFQIRISYNRLR